ncbi:uncharacterized protein FOMMEDRAFT_27543 [Fomitiporia mediterranea MF3/22]|uniref:uncharacterized protein n=1 Tax=Fomitiporia mediterranea (strain MF3/22) TaxID=694068 RepID=UPI0004408812|nr:uncharacterized protein FOMMEDRAFT_27543 [Fomitiporia mediterranea MF3/22]EJD03598.1 hypothetical protein FOMMEDRAFT_27543 [Fomitiporia mediterranea MF3/22]
MPFGARSRWPQRNMGTDTFLRNAILSLNSARLVNALFSILTCLEVMSVTLLAYDFLLTFIDEVRLIWPAKWNMGKVMFFLTRYPVFLEVISILIRIMYPNFRPTLCKPIYQAGAWAMLMGVIVAETIMMMRVYAIWGAKKNVLVFLVILNLRYLQSLIFLIKIFLAVVSSANLLVVILATVELSGLLLRFQRALHAVLTARMLMHIRDAVEPVTYSDISNMSFGADLKKRSDSKTVSNIEFGEPEATNFSNLVGSEVQIQPEQSILQELHQVVKGPS